MASIFITTLALTGSALITIGVFGLACFLMVVAMTVYFMSDDLSLVPSSQLPSPASTAATK